MQPHRYLADPGFSCDLLIDATGHEQCHDFSLACGQRVAVVPKIGDFSFVLQPGAIVAQRRLYRIQDILVTQRLSQEFDSAKTAPGTPTADLRDHR